MNQVLGYLLALSAVGLLCAILQGIAGKTGAGRVTKLACGLLILLVAVKPLLRLDGDDIFRWITRLELRADYAASGVEVRSKELTAALISRRLREYIWDKAAAMGVEIDVEIRLDTDGTWPTIRQIRITGPLSEAQQLTMSRWLSQELAVPLERQVFAP